MIALQRLLEPAAAAAPGRRGVITILRTLPHVDLGEVLTWLATIPTPPARLGDIALFESRMAEEIGPDSTEAGNLGPTAVAAMVGPAGRSMAYIPVVDLHSERVLTHEARQLPKAAASVVCLDVSAVPASVKQWEPPIQARLDRGLHTRVSAVVLFRTMFSLSGPEVDGVVIANPRAVCPLPVSDMKLLQRIVRPTTSRPRPD